MQRLIMLVIFLLSVTYFANAQKVDSMYFHLYTDSLKKGTYNYINVDGKYSNNQWLPLTAKEINFTATAGRFEGNSLFVEKDFAAEKITVRAMLKTDTTLVKEITIYVKKQEE